jgi:hypothetical protein
MTEQKKASELTKGDKFEWEENNYEVTFIMQDITPRWREWYIIEVKGKKDKLLLKGETKVKIL